MRLVYNIYTLFRFDSKTTGVTFYVPILILFLTALLLIIQRDHISVYTNIIIIQGLFIPFASWGFMYRLSEIYEEGAQETLIPYYYRLFFYDALRYIGLNVAFILLLSSLLVIKYGANSLSAISLIHFILLTLFFIFLGTALVTIVRNIEISLTLIFIYTIIEVLTLGEFMPWLHIFIFDPPFVSTFIIAKLIILMISIIFLLSITLIFLNKDDLGLKNILTGLKQPYT